MEYIKDPKRIKFFRMQEYIDKIKLSYDNLKHIENTSRTFDNYIALLSKLNANQRHYFLIESFKDEIKKSNSIEGHIINPNDIKDNEVFFNSLYMSNERIKQIHKFVMREDKKVDYREDIAYISSINPHTKKETIYWYGVEACDINKFMEDFIKIYQDTSISLVSSNPFIKSALISLLFIKIHPFSDGNGRTARLLHEMKFTELINKIYGSNLKICPLHISNSILINQYTYASRLNTIYFDLNHNCNNEINRWFNFCLNMTDEQLYFMTNELNRIITTYGTQRTCEDELFREKAQRIEQINLENDEDVKLYLYERDRKKEENN